MRFKPTFFLIGVIFLVSNFHHLKGEEVTTRKPTSPLNVSSKVPTTPVNFSLETTTITTIEEEPPHDAKTPEELENASKLTDAFSKMLEVFESPALVTQELKKLLEASKTVGLILYSFNQTNDQMFPATDELKIVKKRFLMTMDYGLSNTYLSDLNIMDFSYVYSNVEDTKERMVKLLENLGKLNKDDVHMLWYFVWRETEDMATKLGPIINKSIILKNYSSNNYNELYSKYQCFLKQMLFAYPISEILENGPPSATVKEEMGKNITKLHQNIVSQFSTINRERQNLYWKSGTLENITKKHLDDEFVASKVVANLYDDLNEMYKYSDYNIFVVVNSNVDPYHYGALLHCTTECKFIENYANKNVYILRNFKSDKGYQQCDYLSSLPSALETKFTCDDSKGKYRLEFLVNEIIQNCPNLRGISIIRDGFGYGSGGDKNSDNGFTEIVFETKCFGKVFLVVSNKPL